MKAPGESCVLSMGADTCNPNSEGARVNCRPNRVVVALGTSEVSSSKARKARITDVISQSGSWTGYMRALGSAQGPRRP